MPDFLQDDELSWNLERVSLSFDRIAQIAAEGSGLKELKKDEAYEPFDTFFNRTSAFIVYLREVYDLIISDRYRSLPSEKLRQINEELYKDIAVPGYDKSFTNPAVSVKMLGRESGQIFSWLACEIRALIPLMFQKRITRLAPILELYLTIYSDIGESIKRSDILKADIYWYISDYADQTIPYRIRESLDPSLTFFRDIIMESNLFTTDYLYYYGLPVTENVRKTAEYIASLPEDIVDGMASSYVDGFIRGFEVGGIDLSLKKYVQIRAYTGFERVIRAAIKKFEAHGLECIIYGKPVFSINRTPGNIGFGSVSINPQYDFDHRQDRGLYLDNALCERICAQTQAGYEKYHDLAAYFAGPAQMDVFGEEAFSPQAKPEIISLSPKQTQLALKLSSQTTAITFEHIDAQTFSFTIIAWPLPSIGSDFEAVMEDMIKVNNLDNDTYSRIQQKMIDAMDGADYVHVTGAGENKTDIKVSLLKLTDPAHQTDFENCCADVNIPLGEIFTSPVLKGTTGRIHVSGVYLGSLFYRNLTLEFEDGFVKRADCTNYESYEENQNFLKTNLLRNHDTLPMGEFAIGTNTTAFAMAKRYHIEDRLPILIMEKTGPHFAIGDTCYCHSEERIVYNPDGKEIAARDNEHSLLRKTDPKQAYYNVHTDITIPYNEIGKITAVFPDGSQTDIISQGRFVLPGTEELNRALDR